MRSFVWLLAVLAFISGGSASCFAQQPGPATLEGLLKSDEAEKPAAAAEVAAAAPVADAPDAGPKRPAGSVARPKDGVKHPDLDRAWADYDAAVAKVTESIKAAVAKQFDAATAKGDLDAADKWQTALENFEKAGEVPTESETKATLAVALVDYKKAREELAKAYEAVVKNLTMEKKIAEAKAVRQELVGFTSLKPPAAPQEEKPRKQVAGALFVSCDDKVTVFFRGKVVGKSSQWGQLVGIPLRLDPQAEVLFVAESGGENPAGISWLFVSEDLTQFIASSTTNTTGMRGLAGKGAELGECVEGRHWVSDSLVKRLGPNLSGKAFDVKPVEPRSPDAVMRRMPVASYRWRFIPADLQPVK